MPAVQRKGDENAGTGAATGGVASVRVNNLPIMIPAQAVTAHPPYGRKGSLTVHNNGSQKTAGGVASVRAGGRPVVVTGNKDTCGHARVGGSPDVFVGGRE
jgi:uncharacterized Zn-binding protein involved in type VI secretion